MRINNNFKDRILSLDVDGQKLIVLRDFFTQDTHYTLINEALSRPNREDWSRIDHPAQYQRSILYSSDSEPLRELKEHLNEPSTLMRINEVVGRVVRIDPVLWWDHEGYWLPMHKDNPKLKKTLQIYIGNEVYYDLGTSIGDRDGNAVFTLPFIGNTGYFFPVAHDIEHGLQTKVPAGVNRFSIYLYMYEE